jgi:hypothetical protein
MMATSSSFCGAGYRRWVSSLQRTLQRWPKKGRPDAGKVLWPGNRARAGNPWSPTGPDLGNNVLAQVPILMTSSVG